MPVLLRRRRCGDRRRGDVRVSVTQQTPAVPSPAVGAAGPVGGEGESRSPAGPTAAHTPAGATADGGVETTGDVGVAPAGAPFVFVVHGLPAPQGSKSAFRNAHTGRIQ